MDKHYLNPDEDHEGESGQGGEEGQGSQSGGKSEVGFRIKTEISRDDLLPPAEIRRLLSSHKDIHKAYVDKQKLLRKERAALKEGRKDLTAQYRAEHGMRGAGRTSSRFKKHPISNKAQFSGIDKQLSTLPTEFEADTNAKLRDNLENRYNHTHRYQPTRTFNPKPRPY